MQFYSRSLGKPSRLGVLAGGFNPPTVAHLGLLQASKAYVDQMLCVLPRTFPHKEYFGATLEQRLELLATANQGLAYSIATSEQGLFIDIARECCQHYGEGTQLYFICGGDAAERILTWDYGRAGVVQEMLQDFELLVAARGGAFEVPAEFRHRIHPLALEGRHEHVSSTDVRERIAHREPWEHLVPEAIVERVREIYRRTP